MQMKLHLESWKLKAPFCTSQFSISKSNVMTVQLQDGELTGRGECEPHEYDVAIAREVLASIERLRPSIEAGISRQELQHLLPSGPARNAVDCALWDLDAKLTGRRAWELAGVALDSPLTTAYTISLASPREMARQAGDNRGRPLLKLKLGKKESLAIVQAVRRAAPDARLIVDANGAWNIDDLNGIASPLDELGVELIEQPLAAGDDTELPSYSGTVPLCADESCLDTSSLSTLSEKYSYINIKLDKTGGLTEALRVVEAAKRRSLGIMAGCMTGTSLAMAPAMVIGAMAEFCDLDGPLLLETDRTPGLAYEDGLIHVPTPDIWG
jgi:L-alanine-DL-glutamate epimerase-like enolase superfamily enzyme